jgi:hypothetical protein
MFTAAVNTVMCSQCGVARNLQDMPGKLNFMVTVAQNLDLTHRDLT